jgi:hypothetical protein
LFFGIDIVREAEEKVRVIQANMKATQSHQKSYADKRHRPLAFRVADYVYLKVSPMKEVNHFGVRGKLAPLYIGPFPITKKCGPMAYCLSLPEHLSAVHDMFHVS